VGFNSTKSAEQKLSTSLRKVAKVVGGIIMPHISEHKLINELKMMSALNAYSEMLTPWAHSVVSKVMKSVDDNNARAWKGLSNKIGKELETSITKSAVGMVAKQLQDRQVGLIKSIPLEAGKRAQDLAREAAINGERAAGVAKDLQNTTQVAESSAVRIARTEVAKANASLSQARARSVGATHYFWRTAEDADVRDSHAELDGKIFSYDDPPEIEGEGAHAPGEIWNCRCFAEPIID